MSLRVHRAGPVVALQDQGRFGYLDKGLSRSGAADQLALHEGAALLGQNPALAALEMAGFGGEFEAGCDMVIALTGAPMAASIDGAAVPWNATLALVAGQRLSIGAARAGVYGYLHVAGGFEGPEFLGSRSAQISSGIGALVQPGDTLRVGTGSAEPGRCLQVSDRFSGGPLRVVESFQTTMFSGETRARFANTAFRRGPRANRMGVELDSDGPGFAAEGQLNVLSEVITPGDIQMTGAGNPFILLPECQTTGGYPRIASVLPGDMPRAVQAAAGAVLKFDFLSIDAARAAHLAYVADLARLRQQVTALVRNPHDIPDLLSYQLISGAVSALSNEE